MSAPPPGGGVWGPPGPARGGGRGGGGGAVGAAAGGPAATRTAGAAGLGWLGGLEPRSRPEQRQVVLGALGGHLDRPVRVLGQEDDPGRHRQRHELLDAGADGKDLDGVGDAREQGAGDEGAAAEDEDQEQLERRRE